MSRQPQIRNSEVASGPQRRRIRRLIETLFYPLFWLILLIPLLGRWRRRRSWRQARVIGWIAGAALSAGGGWGQHWLTLAAGVVLLALATLLAPLADPDAGRKLAESLGAWHTLTGGVYSAGDLRLAEGTPLWLFLTPQEMIVVSALEPGPAQTRYNLSGLREIRVDGESYQPRYVSFAKAPPRRSEKVETGARSRLALEFEPDALQLEYQGAFARHLAEIAAHTLYDMRKLCLLNGAGRPPQFPLLGNPPSPP